MKMQRRDEHAHEKERRRGEHADRVEGARKVRKDGIRRRALHVRSERRGELALEPPHTFPPGSHEHTATQETKWTTPRPEPRARGRHVPDERRRIGRAAVDAADKVALRVRDRNLLGCGQRGQDSVGVLAYLWGEGRRGAVVSTRMRAARARLGRCAGVRRSVANQRQSEAIRGNQRQSRRSVCRRTSSSWPLAGKRVPSRSALKVQGALALSKCSEYLWGEGMGAPW
jgi:hypothetical protein